MANALRASSRPKKTNGWFFRAESFSRSRTISTRLRANMVDGTGASGFATLTAKP